MNGGGLLEAVVAARLMPVSVPVAAVVAAAVIIGGAIIANQQ